MDGPQSGGYDESSEHHGPDERDNLQHQIAGGECRRSRYGVGSGQLDAAHHCRGTHGTHGYTREHPGLDRLRSSCKQWRYRDHELRVFHQQRHDLDSPQSGGFDESAEPDGPGEWYALQHQTPGGECRRPQYGICGSQRDARGGLRTDKPGGDRTKWRSFHCVLRTNEHGSQCDHELSVCDRQRSVDSPQSGSHNKSAEPDRPDERDNLQHQAACGECRRRRYGVGSGDGGSLYNTRRTDKPGGDRNEWRSLHCVHRTNEHGR